MVTEEKKTEKKLLFITPRQGKWLDDHGGRNINDVKEDKKGLYVLMVDGYGGNIRVSLPVEKSG
jgi:hypothetical protein